MSEIPSDTRKITPCTRPVDTVVDLPGSKSITNRALLLAALANGESILRGVLDSDDTRAMIGALTALGVPIDFDCAASIARVAGHGGFFVPNARVDVASSGTTARFLTAALALSPGRYTIDGSPQMRRRPLGDLIGALAMLGAKTDSSGGYLPLTTGGFITPSGKSLSCQVSGSISSQFLSALLMAAPLAGDRVDIAVTEPIVSRPYIEMTAAMIRAFGCDPGTDNTLTRFVIPRGTAYQARVYDIEPDASAASYFFALAAILGGKVTVPRLTRSALQGDVGFVDCLAAMGCAVIEETNALTIRRDVNRPLKGIDIDMNAISDTAQTLSVVALFAEGPTRIRRIVHVRAKETDRISAVVSQLRRLGAVVEEFEDGLLITPCREKYRGAPIETFDDHRMAMSFALAGLAIPGVEIENPGCVAKTFPDFFNRLGAALEANEKRRNTD